MLVMVSSLDFRPQHSLVGLYLQPDAFNYTRSGPRVKPGHCDAGHVLLSHAIMV
nr:MAG TPA: hypothetical protein [Caudoviricetes sp.]